MKVERIQTRTVSKGTRVEHGIHIKYMVKHEYSCYWVDTLYDVIVNVSVRTYDISMEEVDNMISDYMNHRSTESHMDHIVRKEDKSYVELPTDIWTHLVVEHGVRPLRRTKKSDKYSNEMYIRINGTKCYKNEFGYHDIVELKDPKEALNNDMELIGRNGVNWMDVYYNKTNGKYYSKDESGYHEIKEVPVGYKNTVLYGRNGDVVRDNRLFQYKSRNGDTINPSYIGSDDPAAGTVDLYKTNDMYTQEQVNLLLLQMHSMIFEYQHAGRKCVYEELCAAIGFEIPKEEKDDRVKMFQKVVTDKFKPEDYEKNTANDEVVIPVEKLPSAGNVYEFDEITVKPAAAKEIVRYDDRHKIVMSQEELIKYRTDRLSCIPSECTDVVLRVETDNWKDKGRWWKDVGVYTNHIDQAKTYTVDDVIKGMNDGTFTGDEGILIYLDGRWYQTI